MESWLRNGLCILQISSRLFPSTNMCKMDERGVELRWEYN